MTKKLFISYSHDNEEHKAWVKHLAATIIKNGIDVILDQWDLRAGMDIPRFVEDSILESDRVLLICTGVYVRKANKRVGGVGLEALIINTSLMEDLGTSKFVPVLRQYGGEYQLPNLLKSRLYIDFSDDSKFELNLLELLRELHGTTASEKPVVGDNPFEKSDNSTNSDLLDLARAYIEMEEYQEAKETLISVLDEGNLIQQREAREILQKISKV